MKVESSAGGTLILRCKRQFLNVITARGSGKDKLRPSAKISSNYCSLESPFANSKCKCPQKGRNWRVVGYPDKKINANLLESY
jgi:hypothetical protein